MTPTAATHEGADMAAQGHSNHGNTVAAWTTVGLLMVASLIMCIAVAITTLWLFIVGMVVAAMRWWSARCSRGPGTACRGRATTP
jgi:hypothetical protein